MEEQLTRLRGRDQCRSRDSRVEAKPACRNAEGERAVPQRSVQIGLLLSGPLSGLLP